MSPTSLSPIGDSARPVGIHGSVVAPRRHLALIFLCVAGWSSTSLAELVIEGVESHLAENVRAFAGLANEDCEAEDWRLRQRLRAIETEVGKAMQPFGYYAPRVQTSLTRADDCWRVVVEIDEGPQVLWRDINVAITGAAAADEVFGERLPPAMSRGSPLRHSDYDQYKQAMQITALQRGYLDASFVDNRFDVWPDELAADVSLAFNSGQRYALGNIEFEQSVLQTSLVRRYVVLEPGEPYDSSLLTRAYRDLSDSGYFRRVEITPEYDKAADGRVPITIRLEPADRIEYTIGAGFATDTGPRLRAGFRNRRVNSRGHRFNAGLRWSPVVAGLSSEYRKPLTDPRTDWLSYTSSVDREDTATSENDRLQVGVRRSKRLGQTWIRTLALDYSFERFNVGEVDDISRLVLPSIAFDHKSADRDLYPSSGRRLSFEARAADESLGSSTSFVQLVARLKWVRSLSDNSRILARLTAGMTAKDDLEELPPTLRFFAGGDESVRGFGYETLGPEDEEGNVIGGSNLLVGSIELERRLKGNFYGAVFVDAGNAFNGSDIDPAVSTGLGIKWRSPIGPLRVYLGHPLNKSDRSVRLHISLGAEL